MDAPHDLSTTTPQPAQPGNSQNDFVQPVLTPEGLPIKVNKIETDVNTETTENLEVEKVEQEPSVESIKSVETLQREPEIPQTQRPSVEIKTQPLVEGTVDKTTNTPTDHPIESLDNLSKKADTEEKEFIENVVTAHEHN